MSISSKVYDIPLDEINPKKINVRKHDRDIGIILLADSIKKHGLLQPVLLSGEYGKPPYNLIVGLRRYLAHQYLAEKRPRFNKIKATFTDEENAIELLILSLSENIQRQELNHADKANAITGLYIHFGRKIKKVANELGLSENTIRDYIKIDELATPKAKRLLRDRKISKEDIKRVIIASQGDSRKMDSLITEISNMSPYQKKKVVEFSKENPKATVDRIIEEANKQQIQRIMVLNLSDAVDKALDIAKKRLSLEKEEIAEKAIAEWLSNNGFLK